MGFRTKLALSSEIISWKRTNVREIEKNKGVDISHPPQKATVIGRITKETSIKSIATKVNGESWGGKESQRKRSRRAEEIDRER